MSASTYPSPFLCHSITSCACVSLCSPDGRGELRAAAHPAEAEEPEPAHAGALLYRGGPLRGGHSQ